MNSDLSLRRTLVMRLDPHPHRAVDRSSRMIPTAKSLTQAHQQRHCYHRKEHVHMFWDVWATVQAPPFNSSYQ